MAGINKIVFGTTTLIDLTADDISAESVLSGVQFHAPSGDITEGTCDYDCNTTTLADNVPLASEIIEGKTAYANATLIEGTMVNRGGVTGYVTDAEGSYDIPQGYHDGSGKVYISDEDKAALGIGEDLELGGNIRQGVTILGVEGTMSTTEGMIAVAAEVDSFVGDTAQTYLPTAFDSTANAISQITVNPISYNIASNDAGGYTATIGG